MVIKTTNKEIINYLINSGFFFESSKNQTNNHFFVDVEQKSILQPNQTCISLYDALDSLVEINNLNQIKKIIKNDNT